MKKIIKAIRFAGFIIILFLAAFAVGLTGQFMPISRERYEDRKTRTEQVDKKKKED